MFKLKYFLKSLLQKAGINVSKFGNPDNIKDFLQRGWPKTSNIDLIRVGDKQDGGYLVPNDLDGIYACFSPGVEETASFETELAERNIKSFMADYSVESAPTVNPMFSFQKKYLGNVNDDVFMTLDSWVEESVEDANLDLLLQMDIEGWEYEVLTHASDEILKRFRIIVIEFHDLISLGDPLGFRLINGVFLKLLKHHDIVHIHPNNIDKPRQVGGYQVPSTMEYTFIRKDRVSNEVYTPKFPHELDYKCLPDRPDFVLPNCWYKTN